ncbi:type III-B CRISPR module RAMP protein Cmr4 [Acidilobus sp.]|uniref:type III-B CRISPR module RAMP protein Cmr4 n=1 Tax=Acidilobus sp. TaxID=1872109 RepID=UPI003D08BBF6
MSSSGTPKALPLLVYAVTPLHVGAGRSLGAVDLPIQRDPYNYPIVISSSFKGALKSHCIRTYGLDIDEKSGRAKCQDASNPVCCCLFGPEVGDESGSSILDITDLIPTFVPLPSLTHGFIYATSTYLLDKASDVLSLTGDQELLGLISSIRSSRPTSDVADAAGVTRLLIRLPQNVSPALKVIKSLGSLARKIDEGIIVFSDDEGAEILERAYIRVTRNRINIAIKTVAEHALWTEEYLPQGTIFMATLIPSTPKRNKYCGDEICKSDCFNGKLKDFLDKVSQGSVDANWRLFHVMLGGKETVGKGLAKVAIKGP